MKLTGQRHRLTKALSPNHRIRTLPRPSHLTATSLKAYLRQFLLSSSSTSCLAIKKNYKVYQKAKITETERASEPDLESTLELSDQEFKTTLINMLRTLMEKEDSTQGQMGNESSETEILRRNQKERLEIKSAVTEMKNAFDGLIGRPCFIALCFILSHRYCIFFTS